MIFSRSLDAPLEPLISKKARVFYRRKLRVRFSLNFVLHDANILDHVRSEDDASENFC